jgi:hypothetical protein
MARRVLPRLLISCLALALLLFGSPSLLSATPQRVAPAACGASWRVFKPPPPPDGGAGIFFDVAGTSPHDVWAVGRWGGNLGVSHAFIEHWDGDAWTEFPADSADNVAYLHSVAAVSPTDAWAVGFDEDPVTGSFRSLIEHWDGTAWSRVTAPPAGSESELWGVAAVAGHAVAVGEKRVNGVYMNFAIRWTGSAWKKISTLTFGHYSSLQDVSMSSAHDVWAVGGDGTQVFVLHGDGRTWTNVPVPTPGIYVNVLYGVDAIAPDDVWAVGESENEDATRYSSSWHWDGTSWTVWSDTLSEAPASLEAVAHLAGDDAWMVGNEPWGRTPMLAKHWDGTSVSPTAVPPLRARSYGHLHGVAIIHGQVWVAGEILNRRTGQNERSLIARMCTA